MVTAPLTCCARDAPRSVPCCWFSVFSVARRRRRRLDPRAYAPLPVGTNFLAASLSRSTGDVLFDPSIPIADVHATTTVGAAGFGRTFALFGKQALLVGILPIATSKASGRVFEQSASVTRTGLADARVKLSMVLFGMPPLRPGAFARAPRRPTVGVSLTVGAPTGQYNPAHLVNLGGHRWAFKPEAGVSVPRGKWTLEAAGGAWFFTENDEFFPGTSRRTQRPVGSLQGHLGYSFRPDLWVAFDGTWYSGGGSQVNGVFNADFQRNSRLGATLALPLPRRQSLKVTYSAGATTRIGGDFKTLGLTYQLAWFDRPRGTPSGQPTSHP